MKAHPYFSIILSGLLFLSAASSCNSSAPSAPTAAASDVVAVLDSVQLKNAGIVTGYPEEKDMRTTIRLNGTVDVPPQNLISVSFPMGGYLKSTPLLPGFPVHKGDPIAVMQDQGYVQLQQDYLTAKARLEYLSADLQRQKELSDADATSKKAYQLALSEYKTQEAILRSTGEKLRLIHIDPVDLTVATLSPEARIYSPIDGYVSKVNVNVGKYVNPTDVLFELVNPADIHAAMTVFEKDIALFRKGLRGTVSLVDHPGQVYDVETILVTRNVGDSRSGLIHCHFGEGHRDLLPGMFLTGVFELDSRKVLAAPEEAIVQYMGKNYLFVTADGKEFRLTEVTAGNSDQGWREITPAGNLDWLHTRIAVKGAYAILGKLKNRMEEE